MKSYTRILLVIAIVSIMPIFLVIQSASQTTETDPETGVFLAAAPNLVINTATGEVKDANGALVVPAFDRSGDATGKYHAAGYVTTVTDEVSTYALAGQQVSNRLVKAVSVIDTTTGKFLVKDKIYYNKPLSDRELK